MRTMRTGWRRSTKTASLWMIGLGFSGWASPAQAHDTGHHADLTRSALQDEAFGGKAVEVAQLQNWLVDYYSNQPFGGARKDLEKLHFDNLFSSLQVTAAWGHLTRNTRAAIQDAARAKNPLRALTIIGASLHAVQDFYTHSNWVEKHPRGNGPYRTETFFSHPPPAYMEIYTGFYPNDVKPNGAIDAHGAYSEGLNHDSYSRPGWDEAYVFAYVASRQWTAAMRKWSNEIDGAFWPKVQSYLAVNTGKQHAHLKRDLNAAYRISEWIAISENDGHWKGKGSGSYSEHIAFNAAWADQEDSVFVEEFKTKRHFAPLVKNLISNDDLRSGKKISPIEGSMPPMPAVEYKKRAVIVRTTKVEELPVGTFELKIDSGGSPDFFAVINVGGQKFVEAMQKDKGVISPKWTTIYFVTSSNSVPITYELFDEDTGTTGADDPIDINPAIARKALNFQFNPITQVCTGDVSGKHNATSSLFVSEGVSPDTDRARIQFYVSSRSLGAATAPPSPGTPPAPQPGTPPALKPPAGPRPVLNAGDKGDWVKYLQSKLNAAGANPPLTADGDFGAGTKAAVVKFQKSRGLTADGDVGPQTWAALDLTVP